MKTKTQERREQAAITEALARESATARQQAFIDHRGKDGASVLYAGNPQRREWALGQLLWPYNQTRTLPDYETMSLPEFRMTTLGVMAENLVVLMDYIEANPEAGVGLEILGQPTSISGHDAYGESETFYRIRDGERTFYFQTCQGTNAIVGREFFVNAVQSLREEADRLEAWI